MKKRSKLLFGLGALAGVVSGVYYQFPLIEVEGESMEPALHNGDLIVGTRLHFKQKNKLKVDDIVVFKPPKEDELDKCDYYVIKRILAISEFGEYWVEGDNKEHSHDSRAYGWINPSTIIAKVFPNTIIKNRENDVIEGEEKFDEYIL